MRWLYLLSRLGLGACLADDMGLGKTLQVLALLVQRAEPATQKQPSLLVAPASLLANWAAEIERFAPSLTALIAHPSARPAEELKSLAPDQLAVMDLAITSYGSLRASRGSRAPRGLVILDEAQAIKNAGAKLTRAAASRAGASRRRGEINLTEMGDEELLRLVVLDLGAAMPE